MVEDENNFDEARQALEDGLAAGLRRLYEETLQATARNMREGKDALGNKWVPITEQTLHHSRKVRTSNRDALVDTDEWRADILTTSTVNESNLTAVIGTTKARAPVHEFGEPEMGIPRRPIFGPAARYAEDRAPDIFAEELNERLADAEVD